MWVIDDSYLGRNVNTKENWTKKQQQLQQEQQKQEKKKLNKKTKHIININISRSTNS